MKVGVLAALPNELGPTLQRFPSRSSRVEGLRCHEAPPFVFAAAGVGARPAAAAALLLVDRFKPQALLSVGFCGALSDELKIGELVLGGCVGHAADPSLLEFARGAAPQAPVVETLTVPKVVVDAEEKKTLRERTGAAVIDMESSAVGAAAKSRGLKFLCVKIVIDTPSQPLASTYAGCGRILLDVIRRPSTLSAMYDDSVRVRLAAERFRDFIVEFAKQIPA